MAGPRTHRCGRGDPAFLVEKAVARLGALREDTFPQTQLLMERYLALDRASQDALGDQQWIERAAEALWRPEKVASQVKPGVLAAIQAAWAER